MINKNKYLPNFIILFLGLLFISFITINNVTVTEDPGDNMIQLNDSVKAQHYAQVADSYLRGLNEKDLKGILSLYADSATVEDPVGSTVISGKDAVRQFYAGAVTMDLILTRTGPVRVAGIEAAFPFDLKMNVNGTMMITNIIDVFRFDKSGKIVSMRAFWGPSNQKPAKD